MIGILVGETSSRIITTLDYGGLSRIKKRLAGIPFKSYGEIVEWLKVE